MDGILSFRHLIKLKEVQRETEVSGRKESPAEHSWSAMILADYILTRTHIDVDKEHVLKLLLYHDVVEIESGDTFELNDVTEEEQAEREAAGMQTLLKKIPAEVSSLCSDYFREFEDCRTPEAQFATAMDKLEPMLHQLDKKEDWRRYGYTEQVLDERKGRFMKPFPELYTIYCDLIQFLRAEDYIDPS